MPVITLMMEIDMLAGTNTDHVFAEVCFTVFDHITGGLFLAGLVY